MEQELPDSAKTMLGAMVRARTLIQEGEAIFAADYGDKPGLYVIGLRLKDGTTLDFRDPQILIPIVP